MLVVFAIVVVVFLAYIIISLLFLEALIDSHNNLEKDLEKTRERASSRLNFIASKNLLYEYYHFGEVGGED